MTKVYVLIHGQVGYEDHPVVIGVFKTQAAAETHPDNQKVISEDFSGWGDLYYRIDEFELGD